MGGIGKDFGSMNMDELLKNIWTAEVTQTMGPTSTSFGHESGAPGGAESLQRQGSLTLPRTLSQKKVDEVWRDLERESGGGGGPGGSSQPQRQRTLGEMTLEEFLVKSGVVREDNNTGFFGNFSGFGFQQTNRNNLGLMGNRVHVHGILKHLRLSGKEHSIPYRVTSRAMEDLINEHGLDIEALKSSHVPLTGGTHMGDSSETQLAEEEDTIKTQERQHKKAGVRISIPLDEILQYSKLSRHSAAKKLKVSISTLKRICRDYGIHRWPPRNKNKVRTPRSSSVVRLGEIPQLNPDQPSNQASAGVANTKPHDTTVRNVNVMTVKAKYVNDITIKFRVSLPPELVELRQQVAKRLDLEPGTYHIKYKDEDGDLILIGCDEDLQDYIHNSTLQGSTSITLLLEPK